MKNNTSTIVLCFFTLDFNVSLLDSNQLFFFLLEQLNSRVIDLIFLNKISILSLFKLNFLSKLTIYKVKFIVRHRVGFNLILTFVIFDLQSVDFFIFLMDPLVQLFNQLFLHEVFLTQFVVLLLKVVLELLIKLLF